MKYAVIGSEGFIGSRIVEALHLGDDASIVAVSSRSSEHARAARFSIDLRTADFGSVESLAKALDRCSLVIHAVGGDEAHLKRSASAFVRAATAAGARRLVYVSTPPMPALDSDSASEASNAGEFGRLAEASQAAAERQFQSECRRAGVVGFALRTPMVYGPRSPVVADITTELQGNRAWLLNGGAAVFNAVYVDNLIAAIRLCLKTKAQPTDAWYVADAEMVTWRDFYHAIARELELSASRIQNLDSIALLLGDPAASASIAFRASLQRDTDKVPFSAASKHLGYVPPVAFAEAVKRTCAWWRFAQGDFRTAPTAATA